LPRLLDDLGLSYAIPRTERSDRPENGNEIFDERVADSFAENDGNEPHNKQPEDDSGEEWTLSDDIRTDGGTGSISSMFCIPNCGTILGVITQ